ncbi:hypothetical protein LSCM4_03344 [Leishmania orientalis]|uniref:Uncharacterized protein n=1 Tax=Leishmania orientalis TaxID=2249476 RepID=A0A836H7F6_9TRYP|nr:hypothetical protein LSCM4_03344 [Leishmania orientalis]
MQSKQIALTATLLFFGGIVWGFVAIGLYVYRTNVTATSAVARGSEAAVAGATREGSQNFATSLPEALPGPSSPLNARPALGNALIRDESLWNALQNDLVAVDVSGMGKSESTEAAVPALAEIEIPITESDSNVPPTPSLPKLKVRQSLHQGGFVIVECCQIGKAGSSAGELCNCATAAGSMEDSTSPCAMVAANHVQSPDTCFYVFRPSTAPYGESQYLNTP